MQSLLLIQIIKRKNDAPGTNMALLAKAKAKARAATASTAKNATGLQRFLIAYSRLFSLSASFWTF